MPKKETESFVEHITDNNNTLLGIVVRAKFNKDGVNFFTTDSFPFQLGFLKQPKGYGSKPHTHTLLPEDNIVRDVQEVVFVVAGVFEVDFYGNGETVLATVILNRGDTALFVSGGHGYRVSEDCKVVTVKQGPYPGAESAKNYIDKSQNSNLKVQKLQSKFASRSHLSNVKTEI
ncbi:MAG: hypothetical protein ABIJ36_03860 [Patescibacteria group bacterium]